MPYVDIDLYQVSTHELLDELQNRHLNDNEQLSLIQLITTQDTKKFALFLKVYERYSIHELEELFCEKSVIVESENQIPLPFKS